MSLTLISYLPAAVGLVLTGLFILLNNPRDIKNKIFATFNLTTAIWLLLLLAADTSSNADRALLFFRFALFFGSFVFLFFYYFSLVFPFGRAISKIKQFFVSLPIIAIALLSFTPLVVESVVIKENTAQPEGVGLLYAVSDIIGLAYLLVALIILFRKYKQSDRFQKSQIRFVSYGIVIAIITNIFTGLVLTLVDPESQYVSFGGFSLLLFSVFVSYTMYKHKFFDVRLIVARSLGYVLSLGLLAIGYGTLTFILTSNLTLFADDKFLSQLLNILLLITAAVSYSSVKAFFDKLTNKLFFRDTYDTEAFLKDANSLLVGQINLDELLKGISSVIEANIKPTYCVFIVRETAYEKARIVGTDDHKFSSEGISRLRQLAPHAHRKMLVTDELAEYKEELEPVLRDLDVSILIRLVSNTSLDIEGMGYLLLGPKKNGSIFTTQDKQALDILANEMVIAVENALRFEEIQKFNITLQEKIDDATKKLRKTNEKLKAMDETKDEFISMASHQLRTPLTSVKGYLSMVLEGDVGALPEMQKKLLDQAFVSSQRMVYLIADLLNVSRLKTGKFVIDSVPTNLAQVVADEIGQLQETAKARKLDLIYEKPEDFPTVMLDETKIRQVVMNFLDNAIYYTPADGKITVQVKDTGSAIEYTVTDSGIGIPKWDQAHLFTKFYRAGNAKKARPDGTGLGLFMAKKVIVAQGGSIIFKSEEGKGSTFGFSFEKEKLQQIADEQAKKDEITHPKPTDAAKS